MSEKPRLRVWTSGPEFDATVQATIRGTRIGSGFSFGECARDMDFEFETTEERDDAYGRFIAAFPRFDAEKR